MGSGNSMNAKTDRIAKSVAAAWIWPGNKMTWAACPEYDCWHSDGDFSSDLFEVENTDGNTVVFNLKYHDGDVIYSYIDDSLDESQYMRNLVDKAYNTFDYVLRSVISNKMELAEPEEVMDLFQDGMLDVSRIDGFYEDIYNQDKREDLTEEDYKAEAKKVKDAIEANREKLENTQDIDFKVKLVFEMEVDEANLLPVEQTNEPDLKLYSECGETVTAYGILNGTEKKLWSIYRLIDSNKSHDAFVNLLDEKLNKWFGIRMS